MRSGFTLVEILIVVIILGILAAIVIPQFTEASNEARDSQLRSDLQTLRSQLELYKVQHLDTYPGAVDGVSIADQLTGTSNIDGTLDGDLGPYLIDVPTNPFAAAAADTITVETDPDVAFPNDGSSGWWFNQQTGEFRANDGTHGDL